MTVNTEIDWKAIQEEIERFYQFPEQLERCGFTAIRAMIWRRIGDHTEMVLDIKHGDVGLFGDALEAVVDQCFLKLQHDQSSGFSSTVNSAQGIVSRERRGDVIVLEYMPVAGSEKGAHNTAYGMTMFVGNFANRNW